jgi:two-component sensor histidine kinase
MPIELVRKTLAPPLEASSDRAAEANHRFANSLSLIAGLVRIQASSLASNPRPLEASEVRLILEEVSERIETVARLHRLLADARQEATVDLMAYLRDVAGAVIAGLSPQGQAELRFAADPDCVIPTQTALPIGLIVVELLMNALKYAHPSGIAGRITVTCRKPSRATIVVAVSDDGVGFPEGFDPAKSRSLGLRVIRSLADQVGARLAFDSSELGLSCTLQLATGSQP